MEMHRRHRRTYTGARQRGHNSPAARFNRRSACQPQFSLLHRHADGHVSCFGPARAKPHPAVKPPQERIAASGIAEPKPRPRRTAQQLTRGAPRPLLHATK